MLQLAGLAELKDVEENRMPLEPQIGQKIDSKALEE
jgi:hypothetical protein